MTQRNQQTSQGASIVSSALVHSLSADAGFSKWSREYYESRRGNLFIYFVGGFTNEELQMAHELSNNPKYQVNVYIGGTNMYTSASFLKELKKVEIKESRWK